MLPNSGMVFTPFDPLPASDLNDIVENVEALSDGTGIELIDQSVTAIDNPYKFFAYLTTTQSLAAASTKVVFQAEDFDSNSNYNTANGRYTVPVDGFYLFNTHCLMNTLGDQATTSTIFRKNNIDVIYSVANQSGSSDLSGAVTAILELVAGDYIEVFVGNSYGTVNCLGTTASGGARPSFFQGFLMSRS